MRVRRSDRRLACRERKVSPPATFRIAWVGTANKPPKLARSGCLAYRLKILDGVAEDRQALTGGLAAVTRLGQPSPEGVLRVVDEPFGVRH